MHSMWFELSTPKENPGVMKVEGRRVINVQNHASAFNSLWGLGNRRVEKPLDGRRGKHFCTHLAAWRCELGTPASILASFVYLRASPAFSQQSRNMLLLLLLLAIVLYCHSFI
ncbi:hypothetical protein M5D96_002612, partial [Drosophila gunungcola]